MALQDYTDAGYAALTSDPSEDLTISENTITSASIDMSSNTWVMKDMGASHYNHDTIDRFKMRYSAITETLQTSLWGLCNTVHGIKYWLDNEGTGVIGGIEYTVVPRVWLAHVQAGAGVDFVEGQETLITGTDYYFTVVRDYSENTVTMHVYTGNYMGDSGATLFESIESTGTITYDYRYQIAIQGSLDTYTAYLTGSVSDLDIYAQASQAGTPGPEDESDTALITDDLSWALPGGQSDIVSLRFTTAALYSSQGDAFVDGTDLEIDEGAGNTSLALPTLEYDTSYVWRVDTSNSQFDTPTEGELWEFTTEARDAALAATTPDPEDDETDVSVAQELGWTLPGTETDDVNVYFTTKALYEAQTNAFIAGDLKIEGDDTDTSYDPTLTYDTEYYWRVDTGNTENGWTTGTLWSFTTEPTPADKASDPDPEASAIDVLLQPTLGWTLGDNTTLVRVRLVLLADYAASRGRYFPVVESGDGDLVSHAVTTNLLAGRYYTWRIDTGNDEAGYTTGTRWVFTTSREEAYDPGPEKYSSRLRQRFNNGNHVTRDVQ